MRNLKRAFSLALALVMVMSMMVVGAGAVSIDDFSDSADIVNQEAVTVLATLGVITGKDDGTYDPTGTITRAEMATIICRVLNGGSDPVLGETVTDSYTDTTSHWAKAYIEYCTTLGIVSGKGDGTFDPNGEVTVSEAAKMVLVALGYNASIEGYTGGAWQINVDARANPLGLYDDLSYSNTNAALTRDNAAQMLYNALDCDMVEYEYVFTSDSSTISTTTQLKSDSTLGTLLEEKFNAVKVEGIVVANEVANLSGTGHLDDSRTRLLVTNYDDQLYYGNSAGTRTVDFSMTTGMEELGRKVTIYVKKETTSTNAQVLGSAILSAENKVVVNYSADSLNDIADDNNLELVTSGSDRTQIAANYGSASNLTSSAADDDTIRGQEKILIDNDDDGDIEYVIVNSYRFGKVTTYVTSGDGSIVINQGSAPNLTADDAGDVVGFEDVSRDDYVIAIQVGGRIYVELADSVTGTLDSYKYANDVVTEASALEDNITTVLTVDGQEYSVSSLYGYTGGTDEIKAANTYGEEYLDTEATFYLGKGGYVVAVGEADASAYNYALVLATGDTGLEDRVRVALSDGSTGTYDLNSNGVTDPAVGTVYRYSINSSDEIRLTEVDNTGNLTNASFRKGRTTISGDETTRYYANSSTAFFYVAVDDIDGPNYPVPGDDTATSTRIATDLVDVYNGYANAPDLETSEVGKTLCAVVYPRSSSSSSTSTATAGAVVFYGASDLSSADMEDSLYVSDILSYSTDYITVEAFIAGQEGVQTIQVEGDRGDVTRRGLYTYTINSDGYYELTEKSSGDAGVDGTGDPDLSLTANSWVTVDSASGSTFILSNNQEYAITENTLLVDDSAYLSDPTGELGERPYEDDQILWVAYSGNQGDDAEAILVVVRNAEASSSSGGSDGDQSYTDGDQSYTDGDLTVEVATDGYTVYTASIRSSGRVSATIQAPSTVEVGSTITYY